MDMKYTPATELGLDWAGLVTVKTSYDWNPATYVAGADTSTILGIEAPLWTETVRNLTAAYFMTVPRLPAVSEVAWTPEAERSWDDFRVRIATHAPRWRLLGVNYFASDEVPWR